MNNIYFISDFFLREVEGGAEQYDDVIIKHFGIKNLIKSSVLTVEMLTSLCKRNKDIKFIISNSSFLKNDVMKILSEKEFIVIEHDYKFLKDRNITNYKSTNYIVPVEMVLENIRNLYKNAKLVICQTTFHEEIIKSNLSLTNTFNLKCSLFSENTLELLKKLKNLNVIPLDVSVFVNYDNYNKGSDLSKKYCIDNKLEFDSIEPASHDEYLDSLTNYNNFVFIPRILESCSRVVIEAMCLGLNIVTRNTPISKEVDFIESDDKILFLRDRKSVLLLKIKEFIE